MENFYTQIESIASGLNTNKVAIIGKGETINAIDEEKLSDFIIINLNDSERIIAGHFTLLHSLWSYNSVKANGFKSKYYVTDLELKNTPHLQVPYRPDTFESFETSLQHLNDEELFITDMLFLSAIKLCSILSISLNRSLSVYFLGFDFEIKDTPKIGDYSKHDQDFKNVFLKTQEHYFKFIKNHFKKNSTTNNITLLHVGNKAFSDLSVHSFNQENSFKEADVRVQADQSNSNNYFDLVEKVNNGHTAIVAEFTNNHLGDRDRIVKMVALAKDAGADLIKVQKRNVDTFYTQDELSSEYDSPFGKTLKDYRMGVELDHDLFTLLDAECRKNKIPWFASILDFDSLEFIKQYDCPLVKLPSTISNHKNFIQRVSNSFKGDLVVSTGFTGPDYEQFILELFKDKEHLWLLQCTSSYPTPPEACQIAVIRHYDEVRLKYPFLFPGYSSHDVGSLGSMLAVAAGAKMIEKHVKLGNIEWVHFDGVAIDLATDDFKNFVNDVRKAEVMCGERLKEIHLVEHHKYQPNKNHN
jgi:sialic acid synthase SpsE